MVPENLFERVPPLQLYLKLEPRYYLSFYSLLIDYIQITLVIKTNFKTIGTKKLEVISVRGRGAGEQDRKFAN